MMEKSEKNADMMLHVCTYRAMRLTSRQGERFEVKIKQLEEKARACSLLGNCAVSVILGPVSLVSVQN